MEAELPEMRTMSRQTLKRCVPLYFALGWSGFVPQACRGTMLLLPANIAPWLWGWPDRFLNRMEAAGTTVFLLGPWSGGFSGGIDDPDEIEALPAGYSGGISTDALDLIAPALEKRFGR